MISGPSINQQKCSHGIARFHYVDKEKNISDFFTATLQRLRNESSYNLIIEKCLAIF